MEAINEFGVGDRTETLTASTQGTIWTDFNKFCQILIFQNSILGSPPIAPVVLSQALSSINATSIDLDLGSWGSGGCDISSFVIEYRKVHSGLYVL